MSSYKRIKDAKKIKKVYDALNVSVSSKDSEEDEEDKQVEEQQMGMQDIFGEDVNASKRPTKGYKYLAFTVFMIILLLSVVIYNFYINYKDDEPIDEWHRYMEDRLLIKYNFCDRTSVKKLI